MAQIETTGGGFVYSPEGKTLVKKNYILTDGTTSVTLESGLGIATNAEFTKDVAGTTRVTVTYQKGGFASGSTGAVIPLQDGGMTEEMTGGSREVPVKTHPYFRVLSSEELGEIDQAVDQKTPLPLPSRPEAQILLDLLRRGVEYYLVPSVVYRQTTFEAQKPDIKALTAISTPDGAPSITGNWLLTSINFQSINRPDTSIVYQVTREWTASAKDYYGWVANNAADFRMYEYCNA